MCGMCPPNAELEEGDPETPVDFLCRIAHLRAHALGIPVPLSADCEYFDGGAGCHDLRGSLEHLQGPDSPLHLPR